VNAHVGMDNLELAKALQSQPIWYNAAVYRAAEIKLVQYQLSQGGAHQTLPVAPVAAVCESSAVEAKVAPKVAPAGKQTASDMVKELKQDIISTSAGAICDLSDLLARVVQLEKDNNAIKNELQTALNRLDQLGGSPAEASSSKPAANDDDDEEEEEEEDEDDAGSASDSDDSDSEDEATKKKKAAALAAYQAKKAAKAATKPKKIQKSMVTIDIKHYEKVSKETLLALYEKIKKHIAPEGLVWGQKCETIEIGFGILKLRITMTINDDLISTDAIQEQLSADDGDDEDSPFYEDIQSTDIVSFNKL